MHEVLSSVLSTTKQKQQKSGRDRMEPCGDASRGGKGAGETQCTAREVLSLALSCQTRASMEGQVTAGTLVM